MNDQLRLVARLQSVMEYEEHEKRAWSVDFSRTEPSMLVSGSDDGKVQLSPLYLFIRRWHGTQLSWKSDFDLH